jgi:hypothetical protein
MNSIHIFIVVRLGFGDGHVRVRWQLLGLSNS